MTTKKKNQPARVASAKKGPKTVQAAATTKPPLSEAYKAAIRDFEAALEQLRAGAFARAAEMFRSVATANPGEPVLAERARMYVAVCLRRLEPPDSGPAAASDPYLLGVVRSNEGRFEDALRAFDRALEIDPGSAAALYARAAACALQGNVEKAVADLRRAVAAEPQMRFQAAADADFEAIREEPSFIDVIEPSGGVPR